MNNQLEEIFVAIILGIILVGLPLLVCIAFSKHRKWLLREYESIQIGYVYEYTVLLDSDPFKKSSSCRVKIVDKKIDDIGRPWVKYVSSSYLEKTYSMELDDFLSRYKLVKNENNYRRKTAG